MGDMWIRMTSWRKVLVDENEDDSEDNDDTTDDVQHFDVGVASCDALLH